MIDLSRLDRPPAGFAACVHCAYRDTGTAAICFTCASEHTEPLAQPACAICGRALGAEQQCANPICRWPLADRGFERVHAVSMRTGQMRLAISRYKYDGKYGWAAIFGRILVGFLDAHAADFADVDLITPSPTFVGAGGRAFDHTGRIVEAARIEEPLRWPFGFGVIVKTGPTERFAGKTWRERRAIAEGALRQSLAVPDRDRVHGRHVLVVDDVFTEGFTLREVARALRAAGAASVSEVVLAREPWSGD